MNLTAIPGGPGDSALSDLPSLQRKPRTRCRYSCTLQEVFLPCVIMHKICDKGS